MPSIEFEMMTDASGTFKRTEIFNPPGPFSMTVGVTAVLLEPANVQVRGSLDVDGLNGTPLNPALAFELTKDQKVSLGRWRLGGGDNSVVVAGTTEPPYPNGTLKLRIEANL